MRLSGRAIFRSLPEVIGTDPAGDALIAGAGADLVAASVSGPSPDSKDIEFMLEVADPLPAPLNGAPEGITYTVMFDNWGSPGILYRLEIAMTSQYHEPGSVDPVGVLVECPTSAPPTCHETCCMAAGAPYGVPQLWGPGRVIPIPTDIDGGVIRARVPIDELTLPTGRIRFYTRDGTLPLQEPKKLPPVTTQVAIPSGSLAMELNTSGANRVDALEINPESGRTCPLTDGRPCRFYSVPKKSIRAGVARAPISASKVPLKATWKAKSNGSFEGTFRKLRIGKRYRFVVEACYGWGNCSRWTRVIKVPR